jgi:PEP-CTERM motif
LILAGQHLPGSFDKTADVPMIRIIRPAVASISVLFLAAASAYASPILTVDQQNLVGGGVSSITPLNLGPGQSFTPTLSSIDAVEVSLVSLGATTARLDLFQGAGFAGPLLGSSAPVVFSNSTVSLIHFDLLSAIALTPGNVYTLRPVYTAGASFAVGFSALNPYSGGVAFDPAGASFADIDLVFREGLHAAAVPEPSLLALIGTGLFLSICRRRGRRV